jgi:hypothetical protein
MTMTGRFLNHGIRISAAIALLLAVMSSPIRPSKPVPTPTGPNCLPRKFATTKTGGDHGGVASSRSSETQVDRLVANFENDLEGELNASSQPSSAKLGALASPFSHTHGELNGCAVERAIRPLRC